MYYSCLGDKGDAAFCFSCSLSRHKIHPSGEGHEFKLEGEEEPIARDESGLDGKGDDDDVTEVHLDDDEANEIEEDHDFDDEDDEDDEDEDDEDE